MKTELKSIKINKEVHKKLKIYCIENELKINFILDKIIVEFIDKNNNLYVSR